MATHTLDHPHRARTFFHQVTKVVEHPETEVITTAAARWLAVTRVAIGWVFLWAFLDKLFGWGYATASKNAWIHGGSPTKGFLASVSAGPMASIYHSWAGKGWADWLFMLGLAAIGVAVIAGVALRIAAVAGTAMMAFMWMAEWPLAKHGAAGLTGSTNPLVDYHVIFALVLIVIAAIGAGDTWGLGRWWAKLPFVREHQSVLR